MAGPSLDVQAIDSGSLPAARAFHGMAYDIESDRTVLFGGDLAFLAYTNDTWAYDLASNSWTRMSLSSHPPARESNGLAYDPSTDRVLLFGGYGGVEMNDTWSYDVNADAWSQAHPSSNPPARHEHAVAFDLESDRLVLFGGLKTAAGPELNDTWAYDVHTETWTMQAPSGGPLPRCGHAMAYDAGSDLIVVFGGLAWTQATGEYKDNETWTYDLNTNTWTQKHPASAPSPRDYAAMAYDSKADRLILFGGESNSGPSSETWSYDVDTDTWTRLNPAVAPSGRTWPAMVYDSRADRMVLFGGADPYGALSETWTFDYGNNTWNAQNVNTVPDPPGNLQAVAGDGYVSLTWDRPVSDGGVGIAYYRVYRGLTTGGEAPLTSVVGIVRSFNDTSVTNGKTYYFRVSAESLRGLGAPSTEVSATPAEPADTTLPTVSITSPAHLANLTTKTVTVTGTASDNVGIQKVEVSLDGTTWVLAAGTTSWSAALDLAEGLNTIHVRVTDTSGNVATSSIQVQVATPVVDSGVPVWTWGVVAAAVVVAAVAAVFVLRRRRRPNA